MVITKLEQYEGKILVVKKDFVVDGKKLFTEGSLTILLYCEDDFQMFMLYNEIGEEHWFSYEQLNEYFTFNK